MENTAKILPFQIRISQCLTFFLGFLNYFLVKTKKTVPKSVQETQISMSEVNASSASESG